MKKVIGITIVVFFSLAFIEPIASVKDDPKADFQIILLPDTPVTDYDGNTYRTMKIGDQVWMIENLKSTHYNDGTPIQYYNYNDDEANALVYGRLYAWSALMNGALSSNTNPSNVQGVAPKGWHIPSKEEWLQLINYLGGENVAGGKLKEAGIVHWVSPNTGATNESGFSALPAGIHDFTDVFQWKGDHCAFSSSTNNPGQGGVVALMLEYSEAKISIENFHPNDALSVRCVKNK
jgi:uncharacterized protein (TIGR02145 family)